MTTTSSSATASLFVASNSGVPCAPRALVQAPATRTDTCTPYLGEVRVVTAMPVRGNATSAQTTWSAPTGVHDRSAGTDASLRRGRLAK